MVIAIDFDGTCVTHAFPYMGSDIGAVPVLKSLVDQGHRLCLFTMRSDKTEVNTNNDTGIHAAAGKYLTAAVEWFDKNEIPLFGINCNPTQKEWTESPKCYAELYIDDAALGIPLKFDYTISERPFVDWDAVKIELTKTGILQETINK